MADPFPKTASASAPPAPSKPNRAQQFAKHGIPDNLAAARERLKAAREKRKKRRTTKTVSIPAEYFDAIDLLADRHDISTGYAIKRLLEEGIRDYCTADERALADITEERDPNFDPMAQVTEQVSVAATNGSNRWEPPEDAEPPHGNGQVVIPSGMIPFKGTPPPPPEEA